MFLKRQAYYSFLLLVIMPLIMNAQCAMCRAVLESEEGQKTAEGINNGILYLMVIPYILVGAIGYYIYRSWKKFK